MDVAFAGAVFAGASFAGAAFGAFGKDKSLPSVSANSFVTSFLT